SCVERRGGAGGEAPACDIHFLFRMAEEQLHTDLWEAVRQEVVERVKGSYKFVHGRRIGGRLTKIFDLYLSFSRREYLAGNFTAADELFDLIIGKARSDLDRAKAYSLRIKLYQVAGKYHEGLAVALDAIRLFGGVS